MVSRFEIYQDNIGEWRWRFRAANHKIIAVSSEGYSSKQACLDSIDLIKTTAGSAPVYEYDSITSTWRRRQ